VAGPGHRPAGCDTSCIVTRWSQVWNSEESRDLLEGETLSLVEVPEVLACDSDLFSASLRFGEIEVGHESLEPCLAGGAEAVGAESLHGNRAW
jgi:hypothetical protein